MQLRLNARFTQLMTLVVVMGLVACSPTTSATPIPPTNAPNIAATPEPPRAGQPIKGQGAVVYRLMEDGTLRPVVDWATFLAWGFNPGDIREFPQAVIDNYPLGAPLTRFVTGKADTQLYALYNGKRAILTNAAYLRLIPNFAIQVTQLPDTVLNGISSGNFPEPLMFPDDPANITATAWYKGELWIADDTGQIRRYEPQAGRWSQDKFYGEGYITALLAQKDVLLAGTSTGKVYAADVIGARAIRSETSWISALAVDPISGGILTADHNAYHTDGFRESNGLQLFKPPELLKRIRALAASDTTLWAATDYSGLLKCDLKTQICEALTTRSSRAVVDNHVRDVKIDAQGALWIAYPGGLTRMEGNTFQYFAMGGDASPGGLQSITLTADGSVWAAGDNYIARIGPDKQVKNYTVFDAPQFLDRFQNVIDAGSAGLWMVGRERLLHFDGNRWEAYPYNGKAASFEPGNPTLAPVKAFPDPLTRYNAWLATWDRPTNDNGRGLHFVQSPSGDDFETRQQIARLQALGVRWTLVNYVGHGHLVQLAPLFAKAGIMVIWRPFIAPLTEYSAWAQDVRFLRSLGLPPYIQLYNEANLEQGPTPGPGTPAPQITYQQNLVGAVKAVYEAGGYVGLQEIDADWLRASLKALKAAKLDYAFNRLFFIPHPYGFNHPPQYDEDINSVLGFRVLARIFRDEIGFVPMMVAGEGGWRPGEAQDKRYPAVSDELHRDYLLAVIRWFQTGTLSNGEPLPDYLFAFCPWLLSDVYDPAAWYDSKSGDRTLIIEAVKRLPPYMRAFKNLDQAK